MTKEHSKQWTLSCTDEQHQHRANEIARVTENIKKALMELGAPPLYFFCKIPLRALKPSGLPQAPQVLMRSQATQKHPMKWWHGQRTIHRQHPGMLRWGLDCITRSSSSGEAGGQHRAMVLMAEFMSLGLQGMNGPVLEDSETLRWTFARGSGLLVGGP